MDVYKRAAEYIDLRYEESKDFLPYTVEAVEAYIFDFQKKYAPECLLKMKKEDVLPQIMLSNAKKSMMQELLRTDNCISGELGHLGIRHPNIFPFRLDGETIKVGVGMPKWSSSAISITQAVDYANSFTKNFAKACMYPREHELKTITDYEEFGKHLESVLGSQAHHGWVHKYLRLIYPDSFSEFHTYRPNLLKRLGIEPRKSFYGTAGQIAEIRKNMSLKNLYVISHVIYNDPAFDEVEKGKPKDQKSIFDGDSANSGVKPALIESKDDGIILGHFGNWDIFSKDIAILHLQYDEVGNEELLIPREVVSFFCDDSSLSELEIEITMGEETSFCLIQIDTDSKSANLLFDEGIVYRLAEFSRDIQSGVRVFFGKVGADIFSLELMAGAEGEVKALDDTHTDDEKTKHAKSLSLENLRRIAINQKSDRPKEIVSTSVKRVRNPYIAEYSKKRANGICQLCGNKAPFTKPDGEPYLESHHIVWLSNGGPDSIENTVALCPNCHRKMHEVNDSKDVEKLQSLYGVEDERS